MMMTQDQLREHLGWLFWNQLHHEVVDLLEVLQEFDAADIQFVDAYCAQRRNRSGDDESKPEREAREALLIRLRIRLTRQERARIHRELETPKERFFAKVEREMEAEEQIHQARLRNIQENLEAELKRIESEENHKTELEVAALEREIAVLKKRAAAQERTKSELSDIFDLIGQLKSGFPANNQESPNTISKP